MTPTKELYRYIGMWRPPWEGIVSQWNDMIREHARIHGWSSGQKCSGSIKSGGVQGGFFYSISDIREAYLRGDFDEPHYIPLLLSLQFTQDTAQPSPESTH